MSPLSAVTVRTVTFAGGGAARCAPWCRRHASTATTTSASSPLLQSAIRNARGRAGTCAGNWWSGPTTAGWGNSGFKLLLRSGVIAVLLVRVHVSSRGRRGRYKLGRERPTKEATSHSEAKGNDHGCAPPSTTAI